MKKEKVVYVYKTDDGIPYADLKKNRIEALECAISHIDSSEFIPSHILINDKIEIVYDDIKLLYGLRSDVNALKSQGIAENEMMYTEEDE